MMEPKDIFAAVYEARKQGITRWAIVPGGIPSRPELALLVGDDGCRLWVRQWPHVAVNLEDDWMMLWEYKHFDVPSLCHPVIDAIFSAHGVDRPEGV